MTQSFLVKSDSPLVDCIRPSPNFGARRGYQTPDSVILHYTGMATAQSAIQRLCAPEAEVSCHYFIFEDGRVAQLVCETARAWHAGRSFWRGERDMNSASIGVEIAHPGHGAPPFYPQAQITAVCALLADVLKRRSISPERVLAHSDIAPGRKIDPGEFFPWDVLEEKKLAQETPRMPEKEGLVLAAGAQGEAVAHLQKNLGRFGFECPATGFYDETTRIVVEAFQRRRRRERVSGEADAQTRAILRALLEKEASPAVNLV